MYILYRFLFVNPLGTRSGTVCYATGTAQTRARLLIPERARLGSAASGQSPPPQEPSSKWRSLHVVN